jgi:hypothetical protein
VHDVERLAIAGIAVDEQRQARRAHNLADEKATSSTVMMPRSGRPIDAVIAAPDR